MTMFLFRRRRLRHRVDATFVRNLLHNLERLAPVLGLPPAEHAAFARDVFAATISQEPDDVCAEALDAAEATALEAHLHYASGTVAALVDFAGGHLNAYSRS